MSLMRYKNRAEILNATIPVSGKFFSDPQRKLLSPTVFFPTLNYEKFTSNGNAYSKQKVEFHVYSVDGQYLTGTQFTSNYQVVDIENVFLDVQKDFEELGILSGNYKFVYNTVLDRVGSFATEKLFIYDISNSRTELILKLENPDSTDSLSELTGFFKYWAEQPRYFINSFLNFGSNNLIQIANIATNNTRNTIYIKLFDPLPLDFEIQTRCWITELLLDPYVDSIQIIPTALVTTKTELQGPQLDVEKLYWRHYESEYKTWNELLSLNSDLNDQVSVNLLRRKFGVKLNIDFTDLNNFFFYSSVQERVLNFIYKVELISWYQEQIDVLADLSSEHSSDILAYANSKNAILKSFDEFELFLYYGRDIPTSEGGKYPIPPIPKIEKFDDLSKVRWIEWAQTWVNALVIWKIGATDVTGYEVVDITSDKFIEWKESALKAAADFDLDNEGQLVKTIPEFIRDDDNNSQYVLFVNMIAQYFDTIWLYIKHFNQRYDQYEHPELGISKDLVASVIKSLGWSLNESEKIKDLWFYFFGLTDDNKLKRTSLGENTFALSSAEYTTSIWKRVLLNLPKIIKSKGTYRSISALLSTYGIPSSKFFVREYGGPSNNDERPKFKQEKSISYLTINPNEYITVPYTEFDTGGGESVMPSSMYFRFIPDLQTFTSSAIFQKDTGVSITFEKNDIPFSGNIILEVSSSTDVQTTKLENIQYVDELPISIYLQSSTPISESIGSISLDMYVVQTKFEKINIFESASMELTGSLLNTFISTGSIKLFGNDSTYYMHEFRYWKKPLTTEIMRSHALSPLSYHGENELESTTDLLGRYVFWLYNAYQHFPTTTLLPISISDYIFNTTHTASVSKILERMSSFVYYDEYVKYEIPVLGENGIYPEKQRIEDSTIIGNLSVDARSELSAYDFKPNDENKMKIGFSPQFNINEDIFNRFGTFNFDEYIGEYNSTDSKYYPQLKKLSDYYHKYSPNITDNIHFYLKSLKIFDFSIFEQIRQVLPAKANAIMGIIIENDELQRIKLKQLPDLLGELSESDKINIVKEVGRTLVLNKYDASIARTNTVFIEPAPIPSGIVESSPVIQNTIVNLNGSLKTSNSITGVYNNNNDLSDSINLVGFFGNFIKNKSRRVYNFTQRIPYTQTTGSVGNVGGQLSYETYEYTDSQLNQNAITQQQLFGYYGNIVYNYENDISASINNFNSSSIIFNSNPFFIKRNSKGTENNRYKGCKVIMADQNEINLTDPGQNLVTSIINIPSGSNSVQFGINTTPILEYDADLSKPPIQS